MSPPTRRSWLDWQRGLAVLCMVEVHALDAWLSPASRDGGVYLALRLLGGLAAPGFLYMAGVGQSLAGAAAEARGASTGERLRAALRRAAWVLGAAYAFRLLEFLLGLAFLVPGGWRGLFKVDVLNVIGAGLALAALLGALPPRLRLPAYAAGALAAMLLTPPAAALTQASDAPGWLAPWLFAQPPGASFALLPWTAFLLAGAAAGELLARRDRPALILALGAVLCVGGGAADRLPPVFAHQDYWHASPAWVAIRLGVVVLASGALQLVSARARAGGRPGLLATLGRRSLLAYVASVELTYGLLARPLQGALSMPALALGIAGLTAVTWGLARAADLRDERRRARRA